MKKFWKLLVPIILILAIAGCSESEADIQQQQKVDNADQLMKVTPTPSITRSQERENIKNRILVTNDANTLQWIYLFSSTRVIGRFPVKGKVTSGTKRLTPTTGYSTDHSIELPDESGAYGPSGEYIFWFDPAGNYHQTNAVYFLSPVPYMIDQSNGTITLEIDPTEESKIDQYNKMIQQSNAKQPAQSQSQNQTKQGAK